MKQVRSIPALWLAMIAMLVVGGCASLTEVKVNNGAGPQAQALTTGLVPLGSTLYVKQKEADVMGWFPKIRKELKEAGYTVVDAEGGPGTYVLYYDYLLIWDVIHHTVKSDDFVVKKVGEEGLVLKSHYEHFSFLGESALLREDLGETIRLLVSGKKKSGKPVSEGR